MPQLARMPEPTHHKPLILAGKPYHSRLLVGTGKYKDIYQAKEAISASGAEIITVAMRRVDLDAPKEPMLQDVLSPKDYTYLPNTAGCYNAEEALRTLRLAHTMGGWKLVKLEVIGDKATLYPNMQETLKAAEMLVNEGFDIMAYCTDEPDYCRQLEALGCAAIMPLAAPIGSGLGILRPEKIRQIVEQATIPVIVDAGLGAPSDAALAMELGCDGVLMNSAIAYAKDPASMASAMKQAVEAGRQAHLAGCMPKSSRARASSPEEGVITQ